MSANAGDTGRAPLPVGDSDVMAAVDRSGDVATFVIADLSVEGAWLAMPEPEAASLPTWE